MHGPARGQAVSPPGGADVHVRSFLGVPAGPVTSLRWGKTADPPRAGVVRVGAGRRRGGAHGARKPHGRDTQNSRSGSIHPLVGQKKGARAAYHRPKPM